MPRNAIVIGMPRSGTSLAASIFARKGYYTGQISLAYKREGDDHNPFGYFEADDLVNSNIEIFHRVSHPFLETWCSDPISPESVTRICQLPTEKSHRRLVERYEQHAPWVWKDPRLCYTLPYWTKLVDPSRTGILLVRRNPLETYRSFCCMGWYPPGSGEARVRILERIEQHMTAATQAICASTIPYIEVDYSDYGKRPDHIARVLGEFFNLELSADDLNYRGDLNHNTPRGRIAAWLRNQLKRLPRRPVRTIERLVPRWLLARVFPERKYTDDHAAKSRENGR